MNKLIGETEDAVVILEYEVRRQHLSICGTTYDLELFTEAEGERRAKEYLEDGELWRAAVEAESTRASLDQWVEDVMNMDGWQHVLGDIEEVTTKQGNTLYTQYRSGGQIDMSLQPTDFVKTFIPMADVILIFAHWEAFHLKDLSEVPAEVLAQLERIFTPESSLSDWEPDEGMDA